MTSEDALLELVVGWAAGITEFERRFSKNEKFADYCSVHNAAPVSSWIEVIEGAEGSRRTQQKC